MSREERPMSETTVTDEQAAAKIHTFTANALTAEHRCARCDAQAFYEAEVTYLSEVEAGRLVHVKSSLLFCRHHATEHHDKLIHDPMVTRIHDYRGVLEKQEQAKD
jgi:hypothetical protein